MWSKIWNPWVRRLFRVVEIAVVLLAAGTAISLFAGPPSDQRILWHAESRLLASPSLNFPTSFVVEGRAGLLAQVYETVITVWRAEGRPIQVSDTRAPLVFGLSPNSTLLKVVPVATQTTIEGTPALDGSAARVGVSWTVFDPGMAIKFAVLTAGSKPDLKVISDVGPTILVQNNAPTWQQTTLILAGAFLGVMGVLGALIAFANHSYKRAVEKKGAPLTKEEQQAFVPFLPFLAILLLGLLGVSLIFSWLSSIFVPAVPLALASVVGL